MRTVADLITRPPVWLNSDHRVETALLLMQGHDLGCLVVIENGRMVGVVRDIALVRSDPGARVAEVMQTEVPTIPWNSAVKAAAEAMMACGTDELFVVSASNEFLGQLKVRDLLPELKRAIDPLTDLPWSDTLREWGVGKLAAGHEVTILFFDIDRFGDYNRQFGHVVGDRVLQSVATILVDLTDPSNDVVCRYGGDEFCLATLRSVEDASYLATSIEQQVKLITSRAAANLSVSVTVGTHGGRRTRERDETHYAATFNSLINLASQDCLRRKSERACERSPAASVGVTKLAAADSPARPNDADSRGTELREGLGVDQPFVRPLSDRLRLAAIEVCWVEQMATVRIELEHRTVCDAKGDDGRADAATDPVIAYSTQVSRVIPDEALPALIAEATISAMRRALPDDVVVSVSEVIVSVASGQGPLVTVVGEVTTESGSRRIVGTAFENNNRHHAVARAVLAATNRPVGLHLIPAGRTGRRQRSTRQPA